MKRPTKKKAPVRRKRAIRTRTPAIILPPTMEQRGLQARALAAQIEDTWEPGCVHLVGNQAAIVVAVRPTDPTQAERLVARLKAFLTELM